MLNRNPHQIFRSFFLDIASIVLAVFIARWIRWNIPLGNPIPPNNWEYAILLEAIFLYPFIFLVFSLYDPSRAFRDASEVQVLAAASFVSGLALAGLIYFTQRDVSRLLLVYFYVFHFLLVVTWRGFFYLYRKVSGPLEGDLRRVLLVGGGETALRALNRLEDLSWSGVKLVGYITDGDPVPSLKEGVGCLGKLDDVSAIIDRLSVDDVLIALPSEAYSSVERLVASITDKPCEIWIVPDYFSLLIYGSQVKDLSGMPMISLKAPTLTGYQRMVKRGFDILLGFISLVVVLPFWVLIAIAIRLDSPGPVFIKQRRIGENWRPFEMYKFRSMVVDAEKYWKSMAQQIDGKVVYKTPNDPRITRVGRFLRRTSLDELPQLINVLRGEMSLVGPRPELPALVDLYEPWQQKRFAVPQGITGWWQINGRSDRPMNLHTEFDLYYVQNYSILLDLQILLRTIRVVLRGKGAF